MTEQRSGAKPDDSTLRSRSAMAVAMIYPTPAKGPPTPPFRGMLAHRGQRLQAPPLGQDIHLLEWKAIQATADL
jgi:hypothetical protein